MADSGSSDGDGDGDGGDGTIRLLIVEDHAMVAQSLALALASAPDIDVSAVASSVEEAVASARKNTPDVALVDFRLPDGSGVDVARGILDHTPGVAVIIITAFSTADIITQAVESGCVGLLRKNESLDELATSIRAAAAGEPLYSKEMLAAVIERIRNPSTSPAVSMTTRELEVLRLLARGKSIDEIAEELIVSKHTVRGYTQRILMRLGAHSKLEAVITALRERIITIDDLDDPAG